MGRILLFCCLRSIRLLLFPSLSCSQSTFTSSRATYYGSPECSGYPSGGCGYGEFGRNINGSDVGAVSRLYWDGTGCGACYQIRCIYPQVCNEDGATIVVTDHGASDSADFILSARAFVNLPKTNTAAAELLAYGVIDIEYRRIKCSYPGYNLMFQVKEQSKYPEYLALIIIYQAGMKDILAVELWQEDCQQWRGMRRAYGCVWDMPNPPKGPITIRFLAADDGGQIWFQVRAAIPYDWKAGVAYDSGIQLS